MSLFDTFLNQILLRLLEWRRLQNRNLRLFCVPGDHIGDRIIVEGMYESELLSSVFDGLLDFKKSDFSQKTCLDIGGNIGNHAVYLSTRFAHVLTFEPNPIFVMAMRASVALNRLKNLTIFDCGLSDEDSNLEYITVGESLGESHFVVARDSKWTSTEIKENLPVKRGDTIIQGQQNLADIALVKIDVEGHELAALTGLRDTLSKHKPIILFESHPEWDAKAASDVINFIRSLGYANIYSYESPFNPFKNRLFKLLFRLTRGTKRKLIRVTGELAPREYLLLIASPQILAN